MKSKNVLKEGIFRQGEVDATKEIMVRNIDEVVRRGEALESLQGAADALVSNSTDFHVEARRVRRAAWWHNTKGNIRIKYILRRRKYFC